MIHTVKGFGLVNKAEIDVFLELSCFFDDPVYVGNLISGSSAFSKTSLNIWKFTVHVLLKPGLENFEHYFTSVWDECNCAVVWTFFGTEVPYSQSYGFSSSHICMWELDYKVSWAMKNWCFWTVCVVLEKTLKSPLDCKEIEQVKSKGNQSWIFIGRTDAEAEAPIFGHLMRRANSLKEILMVGKIEGSRRRGRQRTRWWMTSLTVWTWVWASCGRWWRTGKTGMLQSMESQRIRHDWVTAQIDFSHGKTITLTIWTFVGKAMSLLFNMLPRFVIAFLPSSKHLLISWLQSLSMVILEPKKIKSVTSYFPFIS